MTIEKCLMDFCIELAPIDASAPKFFGFSEFLTSLALMVLAWTTSDARYRFRIDCAPIPLKGITFGVVVIVGMLTLSSGTVASNHGRNASSDVSYLGMVCLH